VGGHPDDKAPHPEERELTTSTCKGRDSRGGAIRKIPRHRGGRKRKCSKERGVGKDQKQRQASKRGPSPLMRQELLEHSRAFAEKKCETRGDTESTSPTGGDSEKRKSSKETYLIDGKHRRLGRFSGEVRLRKKREDLMGKEKGRESEKDLIVHRGGSP